MLCEVCQNAAATVHLTDVSNNEKKEVHLCEDCAQERGTTIKSHMNPAAGSELPEIKAANIASSELGETNPEGGDMICSNCGITYRKFRAGGKFGCPECYSSFGRHVVQLLEKIHQKVQHVGKVPSRADRRMAMQNEVSQLREQLQGAIEAEQYEEAARIRDQIYSIEGRLEKK